MSFLRNIPIVRNFLGGGEDEQPAPAPAPAPPPAESELYSLRTEAAGLGVPYPPA